MPTLLVQGCSKSKKPTSEPVEAFELYSGYYYKIIKKAIRQGEFDEDIDICILSAEYGLLDTNDKVLSYDRKMSRERADELQSDVVPELETRVQNGGYETVILNLGKTYRRAVAGIDSRVDATVKTLGGSLGERGHELKNIIRGNTDRLAGEA
ncbi:DUF6884 domain-containing protein [Halorussus amylolyticus]|uniref:DUF6884 domain-containing protein n=1 Tax=Halorussus amylolyticus TaxID=1126242 RepID=UPI00104CE09A|nr:DUF6884 domain-containing protein [Halorussus amylolyticus]